MIEIVYQYINASKDNPCRKLVKIQRDFAKP